MKRLRIVANRKLRNLSHKIRPVLLKLDSNHVMWFVYVACCIGLAGTLQGSLT